MIITRRNVFLAFSFLFMFVVISPFIERLEILGKPNLSVARMSIALLFLFITMPFLFQKGIRLNFRAILITGILYLFVIYILFVTLMYREKFNELTFYMFYIHLVFFGYWAVYPENLERFENVINILCTIAIIVGLFMMIEGPEKIRAMGIGAVEGKWGQFTMTDVQTTPSVEMSLFFRSFSIFMDHQAFSVFLQLSAFFYRFMYIVKNDKKYVFFVFILLTANTMTFSTTGFLVILVILLTFLNVKYILLFLPCLAFLITCIWITSPQTVLLIFHLGSLQMRLTFIQNALELINVLPSLGEMWKVNFSQDCYLLWMTYKYGIIYTIIQCVLLVTFIVLFSLKKRESRLPVLLLSFVYFVNILTNAVCYSTPNNILLPILFGLVAYHSTISRRLQFQPS